MSQPASNQSEPGKMKKLLNGIESPLSRLPRATGGASLKNADDVSKAQEQKKFLSSKPKPQQAKPDVKTDPETKTKTNHSRYGFLPAFWTIASVISILVNIGMAIVLIFVLQLLGGTRAALNFAQSQANGLLGGLHENFVKMDAASIKTTIHVEKDIPVQFNLDVSGSTIVTLSENVPISGARVTLLNGDLIKNESAYIVLPAGTRLPVFIENLVVPVDKTVPAILDVPVDIPLSMTELHDPFVGLQKVVEPYYCLLQKNVIVNGVDVCANAVPILPVAP